MTENRFFSALVSVELWAGVALIALLAYVFLRNSELFIEDTEVFKAEQVRDSFTGALRILHISWLAKGRPQAVDDFDGYGNGDLNLNQHGWPVAVTGNSNSSQVTERGCRELFLGLLQDSPAGSGLGVAEESGESSPFKTLHPVVNVLVVGTVCVYKVGNKDQDNFSILYNAESGEVRMTQHRRKS